MANEKSASDSEGSYRLNVSVVEKPLRYYGMEDVVPIFAELAAVRHTDQVFSLLFFQTGVPITEDRSVFEAMPEVTAKCIARIVITPKLMGELYKAMETNMQNWQKLILSKAELDEGKANKEGEK